MEFILKKSEILLEAACLLKRNLPAGMFKSKKKFVRPFGIGDTVKYISNDPYSPWKTGVIHIITEVTLNSGDVEYATMEGAWFVTSDFELVVPCNARSLKKAMKAMSDE